mmetsp:Transcript_18287/g.49942  ORF Transcript_18287/g.49942 Transcript_18287/m.49942 type:complete len:284 (-) Transcript_18287:1514-2365(-)
MSYYNESDDICENAAPSMKQSPSRRRVPTKIYFSVLQLALLALVSCTGGSKTSNFCSALISPAETISSRRTLVRRYASIPAASSAMKTSTTSTSQDREWARQVSALAFQNNSNPILLFDGVCNLCNDAVNFCLDHDPNANLRFASLQSKVGQALLIENGRDPTDRSTMVLVTKSSTRKDKKKSSKTQQQQQDTSLIRLKCYTHSSAVLHVAANCLHGLPRPVQWSARAARAFVPQWMRDAVLKFVGENKHVLGETDGPTCRLDLDGVYETRFLDDLDHHLDEQ